MTKTKRCALWLRPFGEMAFSLEQRIRKLSEKYNSPLFEPHVTLLNGLTDSETELKQLTDTLARSLHPFDIILTKAGYQNNFYRSLFVHIQKSSALMEARSIGEHLFNYKNEEEFIPHLSLMYGNLDHEEKQRILNIMGREFHLRFRVHNLLLVNTEGRPGSWEKVHSAEFKYKS